MQAKKSEQRTVLGTTVDGIVIYEPKFPPATVSKAKIRLAVKTVKARHADDLTATESEIAKTSASHATIAACEAAAASK